MTEDADISIKVVKPEFKFSEHIPKKLSGLTFPSEGEFKYTATRQLQKMLQALDAFGSSFQNIATCFEPMLIFSMG